MTPEQKYNVIAALKLRDFISFEIDYNLEVMLN